jgi:hypothetical protein
MDPRKKFGEGGSGTRIMGSWSMAPPVPVEVSVAVEVQAAVEAPPAAPPPVEAPVAAAVEAQPPRPLRTRFFVAPQAQGAQPATRVMPIEQLFPGGVAASSHPPRSVAEQPRLPAKLKTAATTFVKKHGKERVLLYGVPVVLVPLLLVVKLVRSSAEDVEEPVQPPAAVAVVEEAPEPVAPGSPAQVNVAAPPATALERAAVDALARGDYASAQRHYEELARSVPGTSVYSEAARILAAAARTP